MALQSSGTIKMSEINTELGRSSTATISLDTAENGGYATINTASTSYPSSGNPASMSEWYSYNHTASSSSSFTVYSTGFNEDSEACNLFYNDNLTLYYGSGSPACLTTNAYVYTDEAKSTPFDGGDLWYSSKSCVKAYYITEGGYVENLKDCISVPYGLISESSTEARHQKPAHLISHTQLTKAGATKLRLPANTSILILQEQQHINHRILISGTHTNLTDHLRFIRYT